MIEHIKNGQKNTLDAVVQFKECLRTFAADPENPMLKLHPLGGKLRGMWAIRINYEYRLAFLFCDKRHERVALVDIGNPDEVY